MNCPDPGIAKLALIWQEIGQAQNRRRNGLRERLKALTLRYGDAFERLSLAEKTLEAPTAQSLLNDMLNYFSEALEAMQGVMLLQGVEEVKWLFEPAPPLPALLQEEHKATSRSRHRATRPARKAASKV